MFNYKFIILSIIGFIPVQGVEKTKFPTFLNSNPPVSFLDCLYRYFACSDDHTYGKWPMNARVCLRDYQVCTAERKWNQKEINYGGVKITYPITNPNYQTEKEQGKYLTSRIVDYLYNFAYFETICSNQMRKLKCGKFGLIKLIFVFFGRAEKNKCSANLEHLNVRESCIVEDSVSSVYKSCNGRNECTVSTKNLDPKYCRNSYPYLQIKYTCTRFDKISTTTSESFNSSFSGSLIVDGKIDTCFFSKDQQFPWIHLQFPNKFRVKYVLVFAKKGEEYAELSSYEVMLSSVFVPEFSINERSCIKKAPWHLAFRCRSTDLYSGVTLYSSSTGILAIKEVTIILISDSSDEDDSKDKEEKIPYDRSKNNIYSIIDKSCSKEELDVSCSSYGGNIEVIEYIVGRTKENCDSTSPNLDCYERISGILPSCLLKPTCNVNEDRLFRNTIEKQSKCTGINYYEIRFTCTGLPIPMITTSSVDNGYTPDFLLFKENFVTSYYSSKFEDSPWIQVSFKKQLAVIGIQFTILESTDINNAFKNIEVRVGLKNVLKKTDISGNSICGTYGGPPKPRQKHIVVTCGVNDDFIVGDRLTIQKLGRGILIIRDILILLAPESNIKESLHIGGFLIEALFCGDITFLTCERSGSGTIITVDAYAGSTYDLEVCNPRKNIIDIRTECEISLKPIVKNNCDRKRRCNLDLTGTEICPKKTKYRRVLYRCTNFETPSGRASSVESKKHLPRYALDGKIVTGDVFIFKSKLEYGPWFEVDMKGVYIVKAVELISGDINNLLQSVQINVLTSPYVSEESESLSNDYDGFFRDDRLGSNETLFRETRSSSLCAYISQIPDPSYSYIHCTTKIAGKYVVLSVKAFTVLALNEIVVLLAGN